MNRNMKKVSDNILDIMAAKMAESQNKQKVSTCWVASATPCGEHTARLIIASLEPFTVADAINAIQESMNNKVTPFAPSFTQLISEAQPTTLFASVHCYKSSHKIRPADEANMAKCQAITAATYLDVDLGNVWERTEIGGKQYLIRANDDDLEEVLSLALTASTAEEAQVRPDGFLIVPKPGEFITYFAAERLENGIRPFIEVAQVTEVTGNAVGIIIEEGEHSATATLPMASVINVLATDCCQALNPDKKLTRRDILNYLKEAYGPEYAAALDTIKGNL